LSPKAIVKQKMFLLIPTLLAVQQIFDMEAPFPLLNFTQDESVKEQKSSSSESATTAPTGDIQ
jgi:hypothetical protein